MKIRGFRIELGEIEVALRQIPGVREAIVLAREDQPGERVLVGYVVGEGELSTASLREHLKRTLPEYMVPGRYVQLVQLPLTSNGKVDRKALPAPDLNEQLAGQYEAPRTELERKLVEIWQHALKLDRVGIHDNFFELGGHSLLMMRLVAEIRETLAEIPMRALFEFPTVSALATAPYFKGNDGRAAHAKAEDIAMEYGAI